MKICFFGVGGVGGYFGTVIADALKGKHEIYFIARGKHKEVISDQGLTLKKSGGDQIIKVFPSICTDHVEELPVCDIIFLSVKCYDLENGVKSMSKIAGEKTIILPLLNGVDIYERIREHLSTGIVLPSCVYIGTHIESPGVIFQKGGNCNIFIGKDPKFPDFYPESLTALLQESHVDFKWEKHIETAIWSKYMFIAAYGMITATYEKTLGQILESTELSELTQGFMCEIEKIACRMNIPLSADIAETSFLKAKQFPYDTKTSFQRDVESKGKINEIDLFGGTLIRLSEQLDISIPHIMAVYKRFCKKFE